MKRNTIFKILLSFCFTLFATFFMLGCGNLSNKNKVEEPALNYTAVRLLPEESLHLQVSSYDGKVIWSSSAEEVATVDDNGKISGITYGNTVITAQLLNKKLECIVSVVAVKSDEIQLSLDSAFVRPNGVEKQEMALGRSYTYNVIAYEGTSGTILDAYTIQSNSDCVVVDEKTSTVSAKKEGTATLTITSEVEGKTLTKAYNVNVAKQTVLLAQEKEITLLQPTDLSGKAVTKYTEKTVALYEADVVSGEKELADFGNVTFTSKDETIATVDENGKVTAKANGETEIYCEGKGGRVITLSVSVYCPIYSAADLDTLSLVTYTKDKATAEKYLSQNYLFMNDIDYAKHTRNYILPIASPNMDVTYYAYQAQKVFTSLTHFFMGTISSRDNRGGTYYSIGWKDVLGLTDATKEADGYAEAHYLINSEIAGYSADVVGKDFVGINPNKVVFKGKINGNGYAIKNAYYMYDNMHGGAAGASGSYRIYYNAGNCFIGLNEGTIENLEAYINVPNGKTLYNNGVYKSSNMFTAESMGTIYNSIKMINMQGVVPYEKAQTDSDHCGGTTFVGMNNGALQNIYYKVSVGHMEAYGSGYASAGALTSFNGAIIKDCVVDMDAFDTTYSGTLAVATFEKDKSDIKNFSEFGIESFKGSEISGCYSTFARDYKNNGSKWYCQAVVMQDRMSHMALGKIDEISKNVFTTEKASGGYEKNVEGLIIQALRNGNLSKSVWRLDALDMSLELLDGCAF